MTTRAERFAVLEALLAERIVILDGAMGTMVQGYGLGEADYRGHHFRDWPSDLKGNHDLLSLTRPDVIGAIHAAFLDAGADIIETNSFNSTAPALADYGLEGRVRELNLAAARVAARVNGGGHHVPRDIVQRRYHAGLRNFFNLYRSIAESWRFYSNASSSGPKLIAEGERDGTEAGFD